MKNPFLKFSSMAIQMAVAIGGGAWLGTYLDEKYQNETAWWTVGMILLGLGISLVLFIRQANKLSNDND